MGKHEIGYPRIERDLYPTPAWVVAALAEHVDLAGKIVWEPAAGDGCMVKALKAAGAKVYCSDIVDYGYALDALVDFTRAPPHFEFLWSRFIGAIPDHLNIITIRPLVREASSPASLSRPAWLAWATDSWRYCCQPTSIVQRPVGICSVGVRSLLARSF